MSKNKKKEKDKPSKETGLKGDMQQAFFRKIEK
jgi:hypothetical protein